MMKNFETTLKNTADELSRKLEKHSQFFELGRQNGITHFHVATYVVNLESLFNRNCADIFTAAKVYESDNALADFFIDKWNEEKGHDEWAKADWAAMSKERTFSSQPQVLDELLDLMNFLNKTMNEHPHKYMSYMYYAEYMTALVGPTLMGLIKSNLGMKDKQVSALSNHIELDGDHASEVADALVGMNLSDEIHQDILDFGTQLFTKYENFFNALAVVNEYKPSHRVSQQVFTST